MINQLIIAHGRQNLFEFKEALSLTRRPLSNFFDLKKQPNFLQICKKTMIGMKISRSKLLLIRKTFSTFKVCQLMSKTSKQRKPKEKVLFIDIQISRCCGHRRLLLKLDTQPRSHLVVEAQRLYLPRERICSLAVLAEKVAAATSQAVLQDDFNFFYFYTSNLVSCH